MNELAKEENLSIREETPSSEKEFPEPEPAVAETKETAPLPDEVDETPDPSRLKAEIEELRLKREKAEQDALYWRQQKVDARADYFRGREKGEDTPVAPAIQPQGIGPPPRETDFDDYGKFVDALTDYKVQKAKAEWNADLLNKERQAQEYERQMTLREKLQRGFEKYDDFEEVTFDRSATHITPMIANILADCDYPEDVAYYLAKNRIEGVKISRMTPIQATRAIANLERELASQEPVKKEKPTIPSAPPPIKPLGSKDKLQKDPTTMTQKEYNAWRESQGARRF